MPSWSTIRPLPSLPLIYASMWTDTAASGKSHFRSTMLDEYVFNATISVVYKYGV